METDIIERTQNVELVTKQAGVIGEDLGRSRQRQIMVWGEALLSGCIYRRL